MGIEWIAKTGGYGFHVDHMEGNDVVYHVIKQQSPVCARAVAEFRRHKPTLDLMRQDLWKFDRTLPFRENSFEYLLAREYVKRKFRPPVQHRPTPVGDIPIETFPQGTSAGYPYVQIGLGKKGEAFPQAMEKAKSLTKRLLSGLPATFGPSMVYPRAAISRRDEPKCRTIFCAPLDLAILQATYARPEWSWQKTGNTPAAYDYTPFRGGYYKLGEEMTIINGLYVNADFSKYDGSIPAWLTADACEDWMESYDFSFYDDGSQIEGDYSRVFRRGNKATVYTRILMPDGHLYEKNSGMSSGDYVFQLIQNRVTAIAVVTALLKMGKPLSALHKLKTLGDDSLFTLRDSEFDLPLFCAILEETFGLVVNLKKTNVTRDPDQITFLGRKLVAMQSGRDFADIVLAALYPEGHSQDMVMLAMRVVALYYENAGTNAQAAEFLQRVWLNIPRWLRDHLENRWDLAWPRKWVHMFKEMGFSRPPYCRIPSSIELINLVLKPDSCFLYDKELSINLFEPHRGFFV